MDSRGFLHGALLVTRHIFVVTTVILCSQTIAFAVNKTSSSAPIVPAVILFGDSIVDPGNNNNIKTIVKCNFPPYGKDFIGHVPTGRFCNGKIPGDFIGAGKQSTTINNLMAKQLKSSPIEEKVSVHSGSQVVISDLKLSIQETCMWQLIFSARSLTRRKKYAQLKIYHTEAWGECVWTKSSIWKKECRGR